MKESHKIAHMKTAHNYADLSFCKRKKVGAAIVKEGNIISIGWNGAPPDWDNNCEGPDGLTLPHIFHAEENAIGKLAEGTGGAKGASIFITCAPCFDCAMLIKRAGIAEVYYGEIYGGHVEGLKFLQTCGIKTIHLSVQ